MKKKILLVILFLVGVNGVYASDLESVKESNVKALSDYSFDVKYVNQDVNVKRNLEYVEKVYGGQEQGFYDDNMYGFFYILNGCFLYLGIFILMIIIVLLQIGMGAQ